eukprot:3567826-Pyramimonas_sp.AAC.1
MSPRMFGSCCVEVLLDGRVSGSSRGLTTSSRYLSFRCARCLPVFAGAKLLFLTERMRRHNGFIGP